MVAVSLLLVIMLGLLAMFTQTQKAFRAGMTQVDVQEGGRAGADTISRELEQIVPAYTVATNFYEVTNSCSSQPLPPFTGAARLNVLEDLFFLTRQNQTWSGIGYHVALVGPGVGTLYRFIGATNIYQDPAPLWRAFAAAAANPNPAAGMSRFVDGVVHFKVRAYDRNGVWIVAAHTNFFSTNVLWSTAAVWQPGLQEVSLCQFTSNAVPAFVELELGILEDPALERFKALPSATARQNFLQAHPGQVHLFRRRVAIRNVDPSAYP